MQLNSMEKAAMNSWFRAYSSKKIIASMLYRRSDIEPNLKWLEIGCGRGVGVEILKTRFKAKSIDAFDYDPDQVCKARKYLAKAGLLDDSIKLFTGDAAKIPYEDNSFDCVLNMGIIHHCPNWKIAIKEVVRVLKPGGRFVFEEVFEKANNSFLLRNLFEHPEEGKFSYEEFTHELKNSGLNLYDNHFCFSGYYILGVAKKV